MPRRTIPFRGFDESGPVRIYYHGILPHWRQDRCTYFVTLRQADSLPHRVHEEIEFERTSWLRARGISAGDPDWKRRFADLPSSERRIYERLVGTLLDKSLDQCLGSCALRDPAIATKVASAMEHFHHSRVMVGDYVVMPNHVHALLTPLTGHELEDILHSIKSYTANEINRSLGRTGTFWQKESYDHVVRDFDQLEAYQQYIAANPTKAKLPDGGFILSQAIYHPAS